MTEINFSVQVISDTSKDFQADSAALAKKYLRKIKELSGEKIDLSEYKVLIAQQKEIDDEISFDEMGVGSGYQILFVRPPKVLSKLELEISGKKYPVEKPIYKVGRADLSRGVTPDLDLTLFLGNKAKNVSRELFSFIEEQGQWRIELDKNARSAVFLDKKPLTSGKHVLRDKSSIYIGAKGDVVLKISIRLPN